MYKQAWNYLENGRASSEADLAHIRKARYHRGGYAAMSPVWFKLIGPGLVISIGYIDPGNWATDLAAGAYGSRLLWVLIVAGALALLLQCAVARLALASGINIATAIAERWKTGGAGAKAGCSRRPSLQQT